MVEVEQVKDGTFMARVLSGGSEGGVSRPAAGSSEASGESVATHPPADPRGALLRAVSSAARSGTKAVREEKASRPKVERSREVVVTTAATEKVWRHELRALYGRQYEPVSWTVAEKTLVKKMVEEQGEEMVHRMVRRFVSTWHARCEAHGFGGVPGVKLLWSIRANVHGEELGVAQMGTRRKSRAEAKEEKMNADEFDATAADASADVGW
jgi:hypothetical protein